MTKTKTTHKVKSDQGAKKSNRPKPNHRTQRIKCGEKRRNQVTEMSHRPEPKSQDSVSRDCPKRQLKGLQKYEGGRCNSDRDDAGA